MKKLFLALAFLSFTINGMADDNVVDYGDIVTYEKDKALIYPDFKITYIGDELIESEVRPVGFSHYNFLVESKEADVQNNINVTDKTEIVDATEERSYEIKGVKYYSGFSKPANKQKIFWTRGMGEIIDTEFKVGGKSYLLDLAPRKNGKFINSGKPDMVIHRASFWRSLFR